MEQPSRKSYPAAQNEEWSPKGETDHALMREQIASYPSSGSSKLSFYRAPENGDGSGRNSPVSRNQGLYQKSSPRSPSSNLFYSSPSRWQQQQQSFSESPDRMGSTPKRALPTPSPLRSQQPNNVDSETDLPRELARGFIPVTAASSEIKTENYVSSPSRFDASRESNSPQSWRGNVGKESGSQLTGSPMSTRSEGSHDASPQWRRVGRTASSEGSSTNTPASQGQEGDERSRLAKTFAVLAASSPGGGRSSDLTTLTYGTPPGQNQLPAQRHARRTSMVEITEDIDFDMDDLSESSWETRDLPLDPHIQSLMMKGVKDSDPGTASVSEPREDVDLPQPHLFNTTAGIDGQTREIFSSSPVETPHQQTPSLSIPKSSSTSDLNPSPSLPKSGSAPDFAAVERSIQIDDEPYEGGRFVRKGAALSPIVSARRNGSPAAHNRTRSYSSAQNSPSMFGNGSAESPGGMYLGSEHGSAHRRSASAESLNSRSMRQPDVSDMPAVADHGAHDPSPHHHSRQNSAASPMSTPGASPADPYTHFTDFERSKNWRVRRRQSTLDPIYSGVIEPQEGDLYKAPQDIPPLPPRKHRSKVKLPAPPISGMKLFRVKLILYSLYIFYSTWFIADIGFTIYVQCVKMGVPIEIKWERLQWAVTWYHPYKATWLETWIVVIPKVVTFTWVYMSISAFFFTCFSFKDEPSLKLPDFLDEEDYPTVDILLPRYKEPWDLFLPTVRASLGMNYPQDKINVYICDDGHRSGVGVEKQLRAEFGNGTRNNLHYVTRKDGKHAKAGNLNNCLKQSDGDLIVVFDADMVADNTFLLELIPHLLVWDENEKGYFLGDVAFVQTAQCFYNANNLMVIFMDGTNLVYYRLLMMGLNGIDGACMVGTGFVLQRTAVKEIGGFITAYSVEDVTTTLALHQRGWRSTFKYTDLVKGLSPATLQEFFKQRLRWGAGSAQLLRYIAPLSLKGLTLGQRMGNFTSHNYWAVVLLMYIFMMARYCFWIIYLYITPAPDGLTENRRLSLLPSQFLPVLVTMLGLPNVPLVSKIMTMISMLAYIPIYARITWLMIKGSLHPTKPRGGKLKVSASSESYGSVIPGEAYFNIFMTFFITASCLTFTILPQLGIGPEIRGSLYYVQLGTLLIWVWLSNLPVLYECIRIGFLEEKEDPEGNDKKSDGDKDEPKPAMLELPDPPRTTDPPVTEHDFPQNNRPHVFPDDNKPPSSQPPVGVSHRNRHSRSSSMANITTPRDRPNTLDIDDIEI